MLITFEGIDGSGKSTQVKLLKNYFQAKKIDAVVFREPGGIELSENIRMLLLQSQQDISAVAELLLFAASRAELVKKLVLPALEKKQIVILDRFYDSTTAYQGYGRGVDLNIIADINRIASFGLSPSLTFFLDIVPEDAMMRKFSEKSLPLSFGKHDSPLDRMESSGLDFYHRVRNGYKSLSSEHRGRFVEIDALKSVTEIHKEIVGRVLAKLNDADK
ncbi:MAG: thymidylate kinase [[Candidatus Thermochlorobacteriaceae] bacterium GBChlB]|nr:MAG: thymidylate kinase [[Candidatus Thermochlorobacteriaceae] bacterium GBChlB]